PTHTSTLPLHDALPIFSASAPTSATASAQSRAIHRATRTIRGSDDRHSSTLSSPFCRRRRRQANGERGPFADLARYLHRPAVHLDRKSTRLNSSHLGIS